MTFKFKLRVAVVGATGLVGSELLVILEKRKFPVGTLLPFSSGRSKAYVSFRGRKLRAPSVSLEALFASDLVFLVSSDEVAQRYGLALAKAGIWVIDDSSAFRLHPQVPLIIPQINAHALSPSKRLIAGPNCTATGAAVAGYPIHCSYGIKRLRIASYQSVSGAGKQALLEFYSQIRRGCRMANGHLLPNFLLEKAKALPQPIGFNIFPQVGSWSDQGECSEESKIRQELRKLWSAPNLQVSATTVRVPVVRSHSLALWIETQKELNPKKAEVLLKRAPGIKLWKRNTYPTALSTAGTEPVHVGRVRSGAWEKEISLWVVSDNLMIGAALNSVHIAEILLSKGWLRTSSTRSSRS